MFDFYALTWWQHVLIIIFAIFITPLVFYICLFILNFIGFLLNGYFQMWEEWFYIILEKVFRK